MEVLLDDVVDLVEGLEDAAAVGKTEAIWTGGALVLDEAVVEVLVDEVDDEVNGTAGVGGASKRMNKSDAVFPLLVPLLIVSTVLSHPVRER